MAGLDVTWLNEEAAGTQLFSVEHPRPPWSGSPRPSGVRVGKSCGQKPLGSLNRAVASAKLVGLN